MQPLRNSQDNNNNQGPARSHGGEKWATAYFTTDIGKVGKHDRKPQRCSVVLPQARPPLGSLILVQHSGSNCSMYDEFQFFSPTREIFD
ncbi:hypothetical protein J6590_104727 [Homalodisca vitripennis]|nr:hypothetical protein J6590_104727 [Homalodisca vitripennis]